jgi:hypothetical protein
VRSVGGQDATARLCDTFSLSAEDVPALVCPEAEAEVVVPPPAVARKLAPAPTKDGSRATVRFLAVRVWWPFNSRLSLGNGWT